MECGVQFEERCKLKWWNNVPKPFGGGNGGGNGNTLSSVIILVLKLMAITGRISGVAAVG